MAKLKFTQGPWDADSAPGIVQDPLGRIIASMEETYDDSDGKHADWPAGEQEANAQLIGAAPDLLLACWLALGSLRAAGMDNGTVKAVSAAVAKAEGR